MYRLPLIGLVALSAAAATLTYAQDAAPAASARTFAPLSDIAWRYTSSERNGDGEPYLRFERAEMNTMLGADNLPEAAAALASASSAAGTAVAFTLTREAGVIACTGRMAGGGRAGGFCRFDPDDRFLAALAARDLMPADVEELLGLAFVDARLASVDDLAHAGFAIADADELMTVAAIEVAGAYALELRRAGLQPADLDELITAKAVDIEPGWIAAMADAGYPDLDLDKAIELRALGVTPDYARRMARVMRATEGAE